MVKDKPASPPPADLVQRLLAKLYEVAKRHNDRSCDYDVCGVARDANKYLTAASVQVPKCTGMDCDEYLTWGEHAPDCEMSPKPVLLAQGNGYFILRFFRDLTDEQRRFLLVGLGAMPDAPSEPFTHAVQRRILDNLLHQLSGIADHARIVEELRDSVDVAQQEIDELRLHNSKQEASLAAIRNPGG